MLLSAELLVLAGIVTLPTKYVVDLIRSHVDVEGIYVVILAYIVAALLIVLFQGYSMVAFSLPLICGDLIAAGAATGGAVVVTEQQAKTRKARVARAEAQLAS